MFRGREYTDFCHIRRRYYALVVVIGAVRKKISDVTKGGNKRDQSVFPYDSYDEDRENAANFYTLSTSCDNVCL